MAADRKAWRAEMREKHGPDWWKDPALKAASSKAANKGAAQREKRPDNRARPLPRRAAGKRQPTTTSPLFHVTPIGVTYTGRARQVRPMVAVEVAPGKTRAFYMSTGTGGQTDEGEWVPFAGISTSGWFIKPREGKRVPKYAAVVEHLTHAVGSTPAAATSHVLAAGGRVFDEKILGRDGLDRAVNEALAATGAIAAYEDQWGDFAAQEEKHKTFMVAPRARFNSGTWRHDRHEALHRLWRKRRT